VKTGMGERGGRDLVDETERIIRDLAFIYIYEN